MNLVETGTDDLPKDLPIVQTYERFTDAFPEETNAVEVAVESGDVTAGATATAHRRSRRPRRMPRASRSPRARSR